MGEPTAPRKKFPFFEGLFANAKPGKNTVQQILTRYLTRYGAEVMQGLSQIQG